MHTAGASAAKPDDSAKQSGAGATGGKPSAAKANAAEKLKPGQLEPLVLGYLEASADSGPHGPTAVAKAFAAVIRRGRQLPRSPDPNRKVREVSEHPRRYQIAS